MRFRSSSRAGNRLPRTGSPSSTRRSCGKRARVTAAGRPRPAALRRRPAEGMRTRCMADRPVGIGRGGEEGRRQLRRNWPASTGCPASTSAHPAAPPACPPESRCRICMVSAPSASDSQACTTGGFRRLASSVAVHKHMRPHTARRTRRSAPAGTSRRRNRSPRSSTSLRVAR